MVDVTDGADVDVRLRAFELLLGHGWLLVSSCVSYLPAAGLDDLGGDRLRNFLVPVELHVELGPALRHRTQLGRVAEHLRQRHERLDDLRVADRVHGLDAAAAAVEVTHDVAEVVLGRRHLDRHHRLEQLRLRALQRLLERHRARDLERALARVDLVVRAVDELDLRRRRPGSPASTPESIASLMPASTAGMYSFGILPPTILSLNS